MPASTEPRQLFICTILIRFVLKSIGMRQRVPPRVSPMLTSARLAPAFAKLSTSPKKNLGHCKFGFSPLQGIHHILGGVETFLHNKKIEGAPATQP